MSDTIFPTLTTPVAPLAPEVAYNKALIWLSFAPRLDGAQVDASLSIKAQPYRILNGVVDVAPESAVQYINVGSVNEAMANDAQLAAAMASLSALIAAYVG